MAKHYHLAMQRILILISLVVSLGSMARAEATALERLDAEIAAGISQNKSERNRFNPELLNLIGKWARLTYEKTLENLNADKLIHQKKQLFSLPAGGTTTPEDLLTSIRFETISQNTHKKLRQVFGNLILKHPRRVINNVGGIYAMMEIYYCSSHEYIALFGSPMAQSGFSGRYRYMKVYDIMIDGIMKSAGFERHNSVATTYRAQDISLLKKKERKFYSMEAGTLMLDYGRGFILPAFWQGVIAPNLFVNHDSSSLMGQIKDCASSLFSRRS
jgi:hypothetical protein